MDWAMVMATTIVAAVAMIVIQLCRAMIWSIRKAIRMRLTR
jgi:hypothetical protein